MQRKSRVAALALIVLAGIAGPAYAGSEVPEIGPQWMHSYFRDVPADDQLISLVDRTWTRLPDGDVVLFTRTGNGSVFYNEPLLARRFSSDGSLRESRILPPSITGLDDIHRVVVAHDPASADILVLGGPSPVQNSAGMCRLLRFDVGFELKSSTPLGNDTPYPKACIAMVVAADGSVIAADDAGLSRVDTSGNVVWSIRNGDAGRLLYPQDLVLDQTGVIWVASQGPLVGQQGAAVLRFDLDGTFLSSDYYLCGSCVTSTARALDLQEDGHVYATGSPGFLGRYAPSGNREFVADFASGGSGLHLDHDKQGAIYALVRSSGDPEQEVRRLDPDNGNELWARPADAFVATADGVVVTRRIMQDTFGAGYDATGAELWSRELEPAPGLVSDPQFVDGRVEVLAESWPAEPDCGTAPRLVALDADGSAENLVRPCLMPASTSIRSVHAKPAMGVLANLSDRLIAYAPDGDVFWQVGPCPWCLYTWWTHAVLAPDGGAWAVQLAGYASYTAALFRFDGDGVEQFSVPLEDPGWTGDLALFANGKDAIVVQTVSSDVIWHRVRSDTGDVETLFHSLPMLSFGLVTARHLDDGGVGLSVRILPCDVPLCPPRPPPYELLARLTSNGALAWSTPPAWNYGVTLFDETGASNVVAIADDGNLHLQRVDSAGNTTADIALTDVTGNVRGLFGPYAGRLLLATDSGDAFRLWSIGADGSVLASRALDAGTSVRTDSPLGLLVWNRLDSPSLTQWIDPVTLETRASFRLPSEEPILDSPTQPWQLVSDGSIYGAQRFRDSSGLALARLARFTAPGYTPTGLIYRNGFD
jgi:outer membrane protein assembly factor BamB